MSIRNKKAMGTNNTVVQTGLLVDAGSDITITVSLLFPEYKKDPSHPECRWVLPKVFYVNLLSLPVPRTGDTVQLKVGCERWKERKKSRQKGRRQKIHTQPVALKAAQQAGHYAPRNGKCC